MGSLIKLLGRNRTVFLEVAVGLKRPGGEGVGLRADVAVIRPFCIDDLGFRLARFVAP